MEGLSRLVVTHRRVFTARLQSTRGLVITFQGVREGDTCSVGPTVWRREEGWERGGATVWRRREEGERGGTTVWRKRERGREEVVRHL